MKKLESCEMQADEMKMYWHPSNWRQVSIFQLSCLHFQCWIENNRCM